MEYLTRYLSIIVVLILTGSGLPLPEEVPIIAAGVASSLGELQPWIAFASCLVGALVGDCVMYTIGYYFGHNLIRNHPRFASWLHADREARIEKKIREHGFKIFFLSRFMVGVRAPVYLAAGVLRMPFRRFLLTDMVCASSVVGLFFGLSYVYGKPIANWVREAEPLLTVLVVLVVAVVVGFLWLKSRRRLAELAALNGNGHVPPNGTPAAGDCAEQKAGDANGSPAKTEKTDGPTAGQGR
jgi:membrane protein DedA with SNARE-associated domain